MFFPRAAGLTRQNVIILLVLVLFVEIGLIKHVVASQVSSLTLTQIYPTVDSFMRDDALIIPNRSDSEWVRGGGATAIGSFMANLVTASSSSFDDLFTTFAQLGTSRGVCRLLDYRSQCKNPWLATGTDVQRPTSLDYAVSTRGGTESDLALFSDFQAYPFAAAAVALIHNVENLTAPLVLSRSLAAKVFRKCNVTSPTWCQPDDIRRWNDSRILALNPGQENALNAAGEIRLFVRRDSAGITAAVKRAFSIFDPGFATQINVSAVDPDSGTWRSVDATSVYGLFSVGATVLNTPSAVSYVSLDVATFLNSNVIGLVPDDGSSRDEALYPTSDTVKRAMAERGLDYGSDGNSPARRIVEFNGASNYQAYPVVMGAYFLVRKNVTRMSGSCETRVRLLRFAQYLFDPDNVRIQSLAVLSGVVMLPRETLQDNFADLSSHLKCNSSDVLVSSLLPGSQVFRLQLVVPPGYLTVASVLTNEFTATTQSPLTVLISESTDPFATISPSSIPGSERVVLRLNGFQSPSDAESSIAFLKAPLVIRYNWCGEAVATSCTAPRIMLTRSLLNEILQGSIEWWNDTRLQEWNADVPLPELPIRLFHEGFWRQVTFDLLGIELPSPEPRFHRRFANLETAYAFLQNTKGAIMVTPSTRSDSVADDEQTSVFSLDGLMPTFASIDPSIPSVAQYPLTFQLDLVTPLAFPGCDQMKTVRDVGGFLGIVTEIHLTVVSELIEYIRFLLEFPKAQPLVQLAEVTARQAAAIKAQNPIIAKKNNKVGNVLGSINAQAMYASDLEDALRARFFRSLQCADGSSLVGDSEQLNLIGTPITRGMGFGIALISILVYIGLAIWTVRNWNRKVVRFASPAFLLQILFGATMCVSTLFPLSMEELDFDRAVGHDPGELGRLDAACASIPWLYTIGYTIIFTALFLKTWRLVRIFDNPRMKRFNRLKDKNLISTLLIVTGWVAFMNLIWYVTDRLHWERVPVTLTPDRLTVLSSVGLCTVNGSPWVAVAPLLGTTLTLMVTGLVLCYRARSLPSDFQESAWITVCIVMQFQSLLYVLPIVAFTASTPLVTFIIKVVFVFLNSTGTVLLIFIPKMWVMYGWGAVHSSSAENGSTGKDSSKNTKRKTAERASFYGSSFLQRPVSLSGKGQGKDAFESRNPTAASSTPSSSHQQLEPYRGRFGSYIRESVPEDTQEGPDESSRTSVLMLDRTIDQRGGS